MKKYVIACMFFVSVFFAAGAETLTYTGSRSYKLTERTDLRRYENGKYVGLTSREVRSFIAADADALHYVSADSPYSKDWWYDGNFYVAEETLRSSRNAAASIYGAIPSIFHIASDGHMMMYQDNGYPSFRSFPLYPSLTLKAGDTWRGQGERAVDPMYAGKPTRMPIYVEYRFVGKETYNGEPVYRLTAEWATRYDQYHADPKGDPDLKSASGSHRAFILVSCETGAALLIKDQVDEQFVYYNGNTVQLKGTISLFTEYPPALERGALLPALNRIASQSGMVVEETPLGLRLSVRNIQFKPDLAEILPGEEERLDQIAQVLRLAPGRQFLVEGHTADADQPEAEQALSVERARTVIRELVARGIPAEQCISKGWGSTRPVADNYSQDGRAQNRRVEITILE